MIMIDARHIGGILRRARGSVYCTNTDAAKLMNITEHQLAQYETGNAVITAEQLHQLFAMGFLMMRARQLQKDFNKLSSMVYNPKSQQQ